MITRPAAPARTQPDNRYRNEQETQNTSHFQNRKPFASVHHQQAEWQAYKQQGRKTAHRGVRKSADYERETSRVQRAFRAAQEEAQYLNGQDRHRQGIACLAALLRASLMHPLASKDSGPTTDTATTTRPGRRFRRARHSNGAHEKKPAGKSRQRQHNFGRENYDKDHR